MKEYLDYKEVPRGYLHCLNAGCIRSADCLRFKAGAIADEDITSFSILNPAYAKKQNECHFFQSDEKVRYAYGISHLYDGLLHTIYIKLKKAVYNHFGHNTYYRIYRKEYPLRPQDQAAIRKLFLKEGIETEPVYDEYVERYEFQSYRK